MGAVVDGGEQDRTCELVNSGFASMGVGADGGGEFDVASFSFCAFVRFLFHDHAVVPYEAFQSLISREFLVCWGLRGRKAD